MRNPRRHAFTLIELLAALVLIVIAMALSAAITASAVKSISAGTRHMDQAVALDQALRQLRADAWASSRIEQTPRGAGLSLPDGSRIVWEINDANQLQRVATPASGAASTQAFPQITAEITLTTQPAAVVVTSKDAANREVAAIFPSQLLIAGGKP